VRKVLHQNNNSKGFAVVEALISLTIALVLLVAFQSLIIQIVKVDDVSEDSFLATMFLREVIEISKDLEQTDFSSFPSTCPPSSGSFYHPVINGDNWQLVSGQETLLAGKYTRYFTVEPVFRDQIDFPNEIVSSGGVCDENTKKIIATINWNTGSVARTMTLETYVYNY
jgi:hypothetical protein